MKKIASQRQALEGLLDPAGPQQDLVPLPQGAVPLGEGRITVHRALG